MNRRLYFVLPDFESAHTVMNDLLLAHVEDRRMHFLGKYGDDLQDLPQASIFQKSDIVHGMFIGAVTGAFLGLLVAGGLIAFPDLLGLQLGTKALLIGALVGALFGTWVSGTLVGASTPNIRLRRFERVFEEHHFLLMLDVPYDRVEETRSLIKSRHPEAEDHGFEPKVPVFP